MTEPEGDYRSSPITRARRSKADVRGVCDSICELLARGKPMTVRQVFYRLVSLGIIDKTENEYKQTVCRLLSEMRRERRIPYGWIADNTRWMRKPDTYSGLHQLLDEQIRFYRRALWKNQPAYVEIWLEKDALAGVLYEVTEKWDVPLMVTRGYPSLSFLHEAAETIQRQNKPVYLYYLGDHDPSGVHIPRNVEDRIREMAPTVALSFQRVAVTQAQIRAWSLPTRPTKLSDSRARGFEGQSVEVDAIEPQALKQLVESLIEGHIQPRLLRQTEEIEALERETLRNIAASLPPGFDEQD